MENVLEVIEYPGIVRNVDKMLNTLGGIKRISQAFTGEQSKLELRYHYKNPYSKPAYGDHSAHPGLLLRVRVYRSKRDPTRPPRVECEIVGHCVRSFSFENLCDFQYLPIRRTSTTGGPEQEQSASNFQLDIDNLVPKSICDVDYFNERPNAELFCIPYQFARSDLVHLEILRTSKLNDDGQHGVLGQIPRISLDYCTNIVFTMTDVLPMGPKAKTVKRMRLKLVTDKQYNLIKKLFDDCPIWTRIALVHESGLSVNKIKYVIPSLAFYFCTGPWRMLYVRYGYDPRKDFNSRRYQTFDFRLRFRSGVADFVSSRRETVKRPTIDPPELKHLQQPTNYPYLEENKLPPSRQSIMRYCDLHLQQIEEMMDKIPSPLTGALCNERNGWLPAGFSEQVRQILSDSIKDLLHNHYRKEQIQAEIDACVNEIYDEYCEELEDEDEEDVEDDDETVAQEIDEDDDMND